ncbi:hypothetical protein V496_07586 [Pseudogymnoascus sp. VKM F-4515 (FW-2607)]|nr:hypothetical protein V496_07586 [Pseudogymnoascus sp. VKM F-4515 (FW-2607)]
MGLRMAELLSNPFINHIPFTILLPNEELLIHRPRRHLDDTVALPREIRAARRSEPPQVIFDDLVVGDWSGTCGGGGPGKAASGEDVDVHHDVPGLLAAEGAETGY